jgi:hypothetical protein
LQQRRNVEIQRERAEQPARAFGKDQDQRECRQHLVEMVAVIEAAYDRHFDDCAGRCRSNEARRQADPERAGGSRDRSTCEGADHVERSMGEVDQAHDAEDQRQAGGHEEQHHPELQPVEKLLEEQCYGQGDAFAGWIVVSVWRDAYNSSNAPLREFDPHSGLLRKPPLPRSTVERKSRCGLAPFLSPYEEERCRAPRGGVGVGRFVTRLACNERA